MCEYCEKDKTLIEREFLEEFAWGWGGESDKRSRLEIDEEPYIVFVDRGFLRLAMKEDHQCMDSGEKIKIKYCPMCGKVLEKY